MKISEINKKFEKLAISTLKYKWLVIVLFLSITVASFFGLKNLLIEYSNDSMFLPNDPLIVMGDEFKEIFGNDNYVAILVETDSLFTNKNLTLIRELSNKLLDSVPFADNVTSLTDVEFTKGTEEGMQIVRIVPEIIPKLKEELEEIKRVAFSKEIFAEKILSKDSRYSWIMLKLNPFPKDWSKKGKEAPEQRVGKSVEKIISKEQFKPIHPKATGMPYFSYKEKEFVDKESGKVVGIALLIAFIFLGVFTRSFRGVLIPIITIISSVIIVFGLAGFLEFKISGLVVTVPILLAIAISIGYAIHILTFFKKKMNETGKRYKSIIYAVEETGWSILFTALTTISALLSFLIIPVPSIRFVGLTTALIIFVILLIILFLMPVILSFGKDRIPKEKKESHANNWLSLFLENMAVSILKYPKTIITISIIIVGILLYGMTNVKAAFDIEKSMGRDVPYVNQFLEIAETELGSLYSYDLMIEFPNDGDAKHADNLQKLDELSTYIESFKLTKRTTSVAEIIKDLNQVLNEDNKEFYKIPDNEEKIAQMLLLYENAGGTEAEYWIDYEYRRLRIMVEVDTYNSGELNIENRLLQDKAHEIFPDARLSVVGTIPQYAKVNEYVVSGQVKSFFIAIVLITILLMMVFGSIKIGLIGLIPNVFPAITVGGIMGFFDIPLDMITVTIIPMILGLAVDDTIHFLNHGRLEFERTGYYKKSIVKTFSSVGVALILTTLILSANFLAYISSDANLYIHMGILATVGMMSALLADFFITPILIKWFNVFGEESVSQSKI